MTGVAGPPAGGGDGRPESDGTGSPAPSAALPPPVRPPSLAGVLGADGSVRRCTAVTGRLAGACVSALRRGCTGGAAVTRGPVAGAGATGVGCGAHATGTAG
ncbi:hypothetical protein AB0D30_01180 [Streptomyces sp. NPDC048409]|uniref:hypothetical protein n=1 Tax=unclassified Streptomyces TaxID=2593676 RepID=UPI00342B3596